MSDACYTVRATTRAEVSKSIGKLSLTKNAEGQFGHDDILTLIKQITRIFAGQFNPSASGPGMTKLLDARPNALNNKKSSDVFTIESVLREARDEAAAARTTPPTEPLITLRSDAQDEADLQNRFTQAIMGAKEGATEAITAIVGSAITDNVLRSADGTDFKGIDDYSLAELITAAISGADRPKTTDVLDQLLEVLSFAFNFQRKCITNVEELRAKAAKMATFGVVVSEAQLALTILANIEVAMQDDYGNAFRQAMQAIRRVYQYDAIHDATSIAFILKELAAADGVRNLRDAPDVNALGQQRGAANAVSQQREAANAVVADTVSYMQKLVHGESSSYDSGYASAFSATSSDSDSSGETKEQQRRVKKAARRKKEKSRAATSTSRGRDKRSLNTACKHCVKHERRVPHPNFPPEKCYFNKKYKGFRPRYACERLGIEYKEWRTFSPALGGPKIDSDTSGSESS